MGIQVQTPLYGFTESQEKPEFNFSSVLSGKYQEQYQNWLAENFPFRSYLVRGYSQVMVSFHAPVNGVEIGRNKNLFEEYFTNASLNTSISLELLEEYAGYLKRINQATKQENKSFVYLISPAKAEIYPEDLPWNKRVLWKHLDERTALLRKEFVQILNKYEIPYIDFTELMKDLKLTGQYQPFNKTGIHWNQFGAANAVLNLSDYIRDSLNVELPRLTAQFYEKTAPDFDEADLRQLTNAYWMPLDKDYVFAKLEKVEEFPNKTAFAMSTSFSFSIANLFSKGDMPFLLFRRSQYSQFQDLLYYNNEGTVTWESWLPGVAPENMHYSEIFQQSDIIFIESTASELPDSHIKFAKELAGYLERMGQLTDYFKSIRENNNEVVIITSNNFSQLKFDSKQLLELNQLGIDIPEEDSYIGVFEDGKFLYQSYASIQQNYNGMMEEIPYSVSYSKEEGESRVTINIDGQSYFSDIGGINFLIYDKKNMQVKDWVIFDLNNNCQIYR